MELPFDLWHLAFVYLVTHSAPPNFEVLSEVRLTIEPHRADMLLLRRKDAACRDELATVFRRLWRWLGKVTVLEYKSPVNYAFKPGDLMRLWVYGALYELSHWAELGQPDITLVLVVASITPTLQDELVRLDVQLVDLGGGYARIDGLRYTCYVAIIDEVCEAERDEFLQVFSHHEVRSSKAAKWAKQWIRERMSMKAPTLEEEQEAEEWLQEIIDRMPIERRIRGADPATFLAQFAPEQRLAGLDPQQRLAGLDMQELTAALPIAVLQNLADSYINSLAPHIQQKIRQRLRDETH